ncbi:MAG: hypothetical protein H0U92_07395 [Actinobacteria bacterium]|nr:hypothetical protein [Actinomycetota bacterium]
MGAALPDLQREAGVPVGHGWSAAVRVGIDCHREADAVFHDLPVFRAQSGALTRALLDAEVPRGAARAIGHAGWELLLDGELVDNTALVDAYLTAMAVEVNDSAWAAALQRRVERGAPRFYADPASVAELLWRVLRGRRLLAFDRMHIAAVTTCLADAQPDVAAAAPSVFAALGD